MVPVMLRMVYMVDVRYLSAELLNNQILKESMKDLIPHPKDQGKDWKGKKTAKGTELDILM